MRDSRPLASRDEVAEYLGIPKRTLEQWSYLSKGPTGFKVGRHYRYRWADVEAWVEQQTTKGSA